MSPRRAAALGDGETLRGHLVAAAERLLARQGAAGLTVRAIAKEAQVADGVLYNHFGDKEELIAQALHAHVASVARSLPDLPSTPGQGDLAVNLRAYVDYGVALHRAILPAFAGLVAQPGVLARFAMIDNPLGRGRGLKGVLTEYLQGEQALGRVAPTASPEAAATMIVGACHELIMPHLFHGVAPSDIEVPPDFAARLVATCLGGVAPGGRA
ncbi:TetR/AcrR family transcriptional regulator [Spongiactinospora sp. TRM90649]|uniref:TetR/AcrR family transcriptional regulator n=1 Tax=Spongiactinospora sp. TRM90649 TaxID=3031114 RepID=UPI0023F7B695|nr:TetR/AcrR family transcriptional regulator [Spongiactinospora sp. TRM90649]MDF5756372.1 helix-turn-helix domain containing protein [Spongiactinospora sp. TRM90649]